MSRILEASKGRILFRADASYQIGSGHVMRCLTLAKKLTGQGWRCEFAIKEDPDNMAVFVEKHGFTVHPLSEAKNAEEFQALLHYFKQPIYWLIVDHYELDQDWENQMRPFVKRIMVIDDMENRVHDCDLLLDQNLKVNPEKAYAGLVAPGCIRLVGPRYALVRDEIIEARKNAKKRVGIEEVLVYFGGADATGETLKVIQGLLDLDWFRKIQVVCGMQNKDIAQIKNLCATDQRLSVAVQPTNYAGMMNQADLAVGAGGSSTWERACLGLPSLVVSVAENQERINSVLASCGYINYLGRGLDVGVDDYRRAFADLPAKKETIMTNSANLINLVDGQGIDRVVMAIQSNCED